MSSSKVEWRSGNCGTVTTASRGPSALKITGSVVNSRPWCQDTLFCFLFLNFVASNSLSVCIIGYQSSRPNLLLLVSLLASIMYNRQVEKVQGAQ